MIISRHIEFKIKTLAKKYPAISISGPRQSGKTTLAKRAFPDYQYINFEDPSVREYALSDPNDFIAKYNNKVIFDEIQHVPSLFSSIQVEIDKKKSKGRFILTGSQNFLLLEKISQTLAGRIAILTLLPFSYEELKGTKYEKKDYLFYLFNGFYPRIYNDKLNASEWLNNYIQTYIERDVRSIVNIGDLSKFRMFIKLCAGRIGQLVNFSDVANELAVSYHTVQKWLSVLEASYIIFRLQPYYNNFNKRIIKSPKLYFYDVGLASSLLGIKTKEDLHFHYAKGHLFENFIITEILKNSLNHGVFPSLWFWRNSAGNEIDCLIEDGLVLKAIEIKSGKTINQDFFKGLDYWNELSESNPKNSYIVYGGNEHQTRKKGNILNWKNIIEL